jgi:hypothetical protein
MNILVQNNSMKCLRSKVKDSSEPGSLTPGSCGEPESEPASLTTGSQRAKKQQLPGPLPRPEMLLFVIMAYA